MRTNSNSEQKQWHSPMEVKASVVNYLRENKIMKQKGLDETPGHDSHVQAYSKIQELLEQKKGENRRDKESYRLDQNISSLKTIVDSIFSKKETLDHNQLAEMVQRKVAEVENLKIEKIGLLSEVEELKGLLSESYVQKIAIEERYRQELKQIQNMKLLERREEEHMIVADLQREIEATKYLLSEKDTIIDQSTYELRLKVEELKQKDEIIKKVEDTQKIKLIEANGLNTQQKELIRLLQRQNNDMENQILELTRKLNEKDSLRGKFLSQADETEKDKCLSELVSVSNRKSEKDESIMGLEKQLRTLQEELRLKLEEAERKEELKVDEIEKLKFLLESKDQEITRFREINDKLELTIVNLGTKDTEKEAVSSLLQIKDEEIEDLESETKELKEQLQQDNNELDKADDEIVTLVAEKEAAEDELKKTKSKMEFYIEEYERLLLTVPQLNEEMDQLRRYAAELENQMQLLIPRQLLEEKQKEMDELRAQEKISVNELLNEHKSREQALETEIEDLKREIEQYLAQHHVGKDLRIAVRNLAETYDVRHSDSPGKINIIRDEQFSPSIDEYNKDPHVPSEDNIKNLICLEIGEEYEQEDVIDHIPSPDLREEVNHLQKELRRKQTQIGQLKEVNQALGMRLNNREEEYHTAFKQREGDSILDLIENQSAEKGSINDPQVVEMVKQWVIQMEANVKSLREQLQENESLIQNLRNDNFTYQEYTSVILDLFVDVKNSSLYYKLHPEDVERENESFTPFEILVKIDEYIKALNEELNSQKDTNKEEFVIIMEKESQIKRLEHQVHNTALSENLKKALLDIGVKPENFQEDLPARLASLKDNTGESGYDHIKKKYDQVREALKTFKEKNPLSEENKKLKLQIKQMENMTIDNQELHKKIETLNIKLKAKDAEMKKLHKDHSNILLTKQNHLEEVVSLKKAIEEKEGMLDQLRNSQVDLNSKYKSLSRFAEENRSAVEEQQQTLKERKREIKKMRNVMRTKDRQIEELESHISMRQSETVSHHQHLEVDSRHDCMSMGVYTSPKNNRGKRKKSGKEFNMYQSLQPWNFTNEASNIADQNYPKIEVLYSKQQKSQEFEFPDEE